MEIDGSQQRRHTGLIDAEVQLFPFVGIRDVQKLLKALLAKFIALNPVVSERVPCMSWF